MISDFARFHRLRSICLPIVALAVTQFALSTPCAADVLVLGTPSAAAWLGDVQQKIVATGAISGNVDVWNPNISGTPSLAQLQAYSSVLFFTDSTPDDPLGLGDLLADYVDAGGGVVQAMFSFENTWGIAGRWSADQYSTWTNGTTGASTSLTMGTVHVPGHPILAGVGSLDGGSSPYHISGVALQGSAVAIADWSSGQPLIAINTSDFNGRVVGLNLYPPSSDARADFWSSATDGGLLMANALNFAANVVPEPAAVVLAWVGASLGMIGFRRRATR